MKKLISILAATLLLFNTAALAAIPGEYTSVGDTQVIDFNFASAEEATTNGMTGESADIAIDLTGGTDGTGALKITGTGTQYSKVYFYLDQPMQVGKTYYVSYQIKTSANRGAITAATYGTRLFDDKTIYAGAWTKVGGNVTITSEMAKDNESTNLAITVWGAIENEVTYIDNIEITEISSDIKTVTPPADATVIKSTRLTFEDGKYDCWYNNSWNRSNFSVTNEISHYGNHSLKVALGSGWNGITLKTSEMTNGFGFENNKTYNVTAYVYVPTTKTYIWGQNVWENSSTGNTQRFNEESFIKAEPGVWTKISGTFTTPSDGTPHIGGRIQFFADGTSNSYVYFDDVVVSEIDAPADLAVTSSSYAATDGASGTITAKTNYEIVHIESVTIDGNATVSGYTLSDDGKTITANLSELVGKTAYTVSYKVVDAFGRVSTVTSQFTSPDATSLIISTSFENENYITSLDSGNPDAGLSTDYAKTGNYSYKMPSGFTYYMKKSGYNLVPGETYYFETYAKAPNLQTGYKLQVFAYQFKDSNLGVKVELTDDKWTKVAYKCTIPADAEGNLDLLNMFGITLYDENGNDLKGTQSLPVYLDDLKFYKVAPIAAEYDEEISFVNPTITVTMTNAVDTAITKDNFTVTGDATISSVSVDGNVVTITLANVKPNTAYTITPVDVKDVFMQKFETAINVKTKAEFDVDISAETKNGAYAATGKITNNTASEAEVAVIVASYSGKVLKAVNMDKHKIASNGYANFSASVNTASGETTRTFVWNWGNLAPIATR